jgi:hypothetical protein
MVEGKQQIPEEMIGAMSESKCQLTLAFIGLLLCL